MPSDHRVIGRFDIVSAPKFDPEDLDRRFFDYLVESRSLWSFVVDRLINTLGCQVELRVSCAAFGSATTVSLIVRADQLDGDAVDIGGILQLLPKQFEWAIADPCVDELADKLWISRVIRRLEFIDLPVASSVALGALSVSSAVDVPRTSPSTIGSATSDVILGFPFGDSRFYRELPSTSTTFPDFQNTRFCLPLPGTIEALKPRQRSMFEEVQRLAPICISISMSSLGERKKQIAPILALNWKRFLTPFANELAASGFANVGELHRSFSRFSLPSSYLVDATIRVGAPDVGASLGLASVVAASLGGPFAFRVLPASKGSSPANLWLKDVDVPAIGWSNDRLKSEQRKLARQLEVEGVSVIEEAEVEEFLLSLPHIYAADEVQQIVRLPIADEDGLPGIETAMVAPFSIPDTTISVGKIGDLSSDAVKDRVRLGVIPSLYAPRARGPAETHEQSGWHTISPIDLTKHAFIVGGTGSGKTMTTLFLCRELHRLKVPFLVVEPVKTEYFDRLRECIPNLKRLRFEADGKAGPASDYLAFEPFRVPEGITVARHASYLKSCFEAAFPLDALMSLFLENGLLEYYKSPQTEGGCGLSLFDRGGVQTVKIVDGHVFPSFATFVKFFSDTYVVRETANMSTAQGRNPAQELRDIFRRRFANLSEGLIGQSFRLADRRLVVAAEKGLPLGKAYDPIGLVLNGPLVIELDGIPDSDQKALAMAFLLTDLFERRQSEDFSARSRNEPNPERLKHFLVVEEAHRLLGNDTGGGRGGDMVGASSRAKAVSMFVDMLAEIRAYGQGLAIVEQIPTKIVPEAVKNTNLKIMLRLAARDDREYLGQAMNFSESQMRYVTNLKVERGKRINFVLFEEGVEQPLMASLPLPPPGSDARPYDELF